GGVALVGVWSDGVGLTGLAGMLIVTVLVELMTRELGGGLGTQLATALVWALSPYGLAAASIFHPTWFDVLCWVALLYTLLIALRRERPHLWLLAGGIAGIGFGTE